MKRFPLRWMDGWISRAARGGACGRESSSADLFGRAHEKILIFYCRGLLIRYYSRKGKRLPAQTDGWMDGSHAQHEIHEGRAAAWPRLAQLVVDGETNKMALVRKCTMVRNE